MKRPILEDMIVSGLTLTEAGDGPVKRRVAKGRFGMCGESTANGRSYPRSLMEREIGKLQPKIEDGILYGELDHPEDGKTLLQRACCRITRLEVMPDGEVQGEAIILNTPNGNTLLGVLEGGGKVGVSSRGFGSTVRDNKGNEVVAEDFVLKSYDFVAEPAVRSAIPVFESDEGGSDDISWLTPEIVETEFPELYESIKLRIGESAPDHAADNAAVIEAEVARRMAEASERYQSELAEALVKIRAEVVAEVTESLLADPEVGGAKAALAAVVTMLKPYVSTDDELALDDRAKVAEAERDEALAKLAEAAELARATEHALYVERTAFGHPLISTIRSVMGRAKYESQEQCEQALSLLLADLDGLGDAVSKAGKVEAELGEVVEKLGEAAEVIEEYEAMKAKYEAAMVKTATRLDEAEARNAKLQKDLDAAAAKAATAETGRSALQEAVTRIRGGGSVVKALEEGRDIVDAVYGDDEPLDDIRSRLRRGHPNGRRSSLTESSSDQGFGAGSTVNGVDMAELARLAGLAGLEGG